MLGRWGVLCPQCRRDVTYWSGSFGSTRQGLEGDLCPWRCSDVTSDTGEPPNRDQTTLLQSPLPVPWPHHPEGQHRQVPTAWPWLALHPAPHPWDSLPCPWGFLNPPPPDLLPPTLPVLARLAAERALLFIPALAQPNCSST